MYPLGAIQAKEIVWKGVLVATFLLDLAAIFVSQDGVSTVDSSQYYSSFSELIGDPIVQNVIGKYRLSVAEVIRKCKTHARENLKWINELELELEVYEWTSSVVVIVLPTGKKYQQRSKICLKESKTLKFSFPVPFLHDNN